MRANLLFGSYGANLEKSQRLGTDCEKTSKWATMAARNRETPSVRTIESELLNPSFSIQSLSLQPDTSEPTDLKKPVCSMWISRPRLQLLELGRPWKTKRSRCNMFNASFCIILRMLRFSLLNIEDTINNHTIMFVRLKSIALVNPYI